MSRAQRQLIQTGDLLAWSSLGAGKSNAVLNLVRWATLSDYGHVSVAWVRDGDLFHVEATMPRIRVAKILPSDRFYHISMSKCIDDVCELQGLNMDFFNDKVGLRYSILDALRAYFGLIPKADDRYQCAELTREYYATLGIDLGKTLTPTGIVQAALDLPGSRMIKINPEPLPLES